MIEVFFLIETSTRKEQIRSSSYFKLIFVVLYKQKNVSAYYISDIK